MGPCADEAARLLAAGFLPVPAYKKHPTVSHKPLLGGRPQWFRNMVPYSMGLFDQKGELGLLCDDGLIVLDFDDVRSYEETRAAGFGDFFDSTSMATTRKGVHVFGRRTPLCDELRVYDGPMTKKGVKYNMDLKTITDSKTTIRGPDGKPTVYHTPGFCDVFPSPNKTWVRHVIDCPPKPLPDALVRLLAELRATGEGQRAAGRAAAEATAGPGRPAKRARVEAPPGPGAVPFWRPGELNVPCLVAMGFPRAAMSGAYVYHFSEDSKIFESGYVGGAVSRFQLQKGVPCPLCGTEVGHDNSFWVAHLPDGSRRIKSDSPICKPFWRGPDGTGRKQPGLFKRSVELPWSASGLAGWVRAFKATGVALPAAAAERLAQAYQGFARVRDVACVGGRLLVLTYDEGDKPATAVIAFGPADARFGYACAARAERPWATKGIDMRPIPVPVSFFEDLVA